MKRIVLFLAAFCLLAQQGFCSQEPYELKSSALEGCEAIYEDCSLSNETCLLWERAIDEIGQSIDSSLWWDGLHLNSDSTKKAVSPVFEAEKKAVISLRSLESNWSDVRAGPFIDDLVLADQLIAYASMGDAGYCIPYVTETVKWNISREIEEAEKFCSMADSFSGSGQVVAAIEHYELCWKRAEAAVLKADEQIIPLISLADHPLYVNNDSFNLSGSLVDAAPYSFNGLYAVIDGTAIPLNVSNHAFSVILQLKEGVNDITVTAEDLYGNTGTDSTQAVLDTLPPEIVFSGVADGDILDRDTDIEVGIYDLNLEEAETLLDGEPFPNGTVSDEGWHNLSVYASDKAGNNATSSVRFLLDKTAPEVRIDSPADGSWVAGTVTVDGTVEDANLDSYALYINGLKVSSDLPYTWDTTDYPDAIYDLTLSASDEAGRVSEATHVIYVENVKLEMSVAELTVNPTLAKPGYLLAGYVNKNATVTINGEETNPINYSFTANLTLHEGINTIKVQARDALGVTVNWTQSRAIDSDRLPDWYEVTVLGTDPLDGDSDGNGISDDFEDPDSDMVTNYLEYLFRTDPFSDDSEGDGLSDFFELQYLGSSPLLEDSNLNNISDAAEDPDNDSLDNLEEQLFGSHPWRNDSDYDGLTDPVERSLGSDPLRGDSDDDGLSDWSEVNLGTDLLSNDSDGDGLLDGSETFTLSFSSPEGDAVAEVSGIGDYTCLVSVEYYDESVNPLSAYGELPGYAAAASFEALKNFSSARIRVYYPGDVNESNLSLFYWDQSSLEFMEVDDQHLNANENYIEAEVGHFSLYFVIDVSYFGGWYDARLDEGDTVRVSVPVHNEGNDTAINARVGFYDGNPYLGASLIREETVSSLAPGTSSVVSFEYVLPGNVDLWVSVDYSDQVLEWDESNNDARRLYTNRDSDNDGLSDYEEVYGTRLKFPFILKPIEDPLSVPDYDGDGLPDIDSDGDGVPNAYDNDSDDDGLPDGEEMTGVGLREGRVYHTFMANPYVVDSDGDGLSDKDEVDGWYVKVIDSREKAVSYAEALDAAFGSGGNASDVDTEPYITEYKVYPNPFEEDSDGDGLGDQTEFYLSLDPWSMDSDEDLISDYVEYADDLFPDIFDVQGPVIEVTGWDEFLSLWKYGVHFNIKDRAGLFSAFLVREPGGAVVSLPVGNAHSFDGGAEIDLPDGFEGLTIVLNASDVNGNWNTRVINYEGIFIGTANAVSNLFVQQLNGTSSYYDYPFKLGLTSGVIYGVGGGLTDLANLIDYEQFIDGMEKLYDTLKEDWTVIDDMVLALPKQAWDYQVQANPYKLVTEPVEYAQFSAGFFGGYGGGTLAMMVVGDKALGKLASLSRINEVLLASRPILSRVVVISKGRLTVLSTVASDFFGGAAKVKSSFYRSSTVVGLADTARSLKSAGVGLVDDFAHTEAFVRVMSLRNSKTGRVFFRASMKEANDIGFDVTKFSKWPVEVVEEVQKKGLKVVGKQALDTLDSKIIALDDAGLLAKYGVKSVDEVETGHKILARYGSNAASIGSDQFKAVHVLETRQAGMIDELAGSTHLSGTDDLVKVAQLEQRSEGMASALKNVMNKEGARGTVDDLLDFSDADELLGAKKLLSEGKTIDYLQTLKGAPWTAKEIKEILKYKASDPAKLLKKLNVRGSRPNSGQTVLGHTDEFSPKDYRVVADALNANHMNIVPERSYYKLAAAGMDEKVTYQFLDEAMARGDKMVLINPLDVQPNTVYKLELQYLDLKGYTNREILNLV